MKPIRLSLSVLSLAMLSPFVVQFTPVHAQGAVWTEQAPMPTPRAGLSAAFLNGILYACGGDIGGAHVNTVEAYNPASNTWTSVAPMQSARWLGDVAAVNGLLYAFGGYPTSGYDNVTPLVEAYNPLSNTWTTVTTMPTPRGSMGINVVNGIIYTIGGSTSHQQWSTVEAYNPASNTWAELSPMPTPRQFLSSAAVNGTIYAIGGYNNVTALNTVEAYDTVHDSWSTKASLPTTVCLSWAATINGLIYVQGSTPNGPDGTIFVYNPLTDGWSTNAPAMPTVRSSSGADVFNNTAYIVGGSNPLGTFLGTNETFAPYMVVNIGLFIGVTVLGQVGQAYEIDYTSSLLTSNWSPLATITLPCNPYVYCDTNSPGCPNRFYRVTAVP